MTPPRLGALTDAEYAVFAIEWELRDVNRRIALLSDERNVIVSKRNKILEDQEKCRKKIALKSTS